MRTLALVIVFLIACAVNSGQVIAPAGAPAGGTSPGAAIPAASASTTSPAIDIKAFRAATIQEAYYSADGSKIVQIAGKSVQYHTSAEGYDYYVITTPSKGVTGEGYKIRASGASSPSSPSQGRPSTAVATFSSKADTSAIVFSKSAVKPKEYYIAKTSDGIAVIPDPANQDGLIKIEQWQANQLKDMQGKGYYFPPDALKTDGFTIFESLTLESTTGKTTRSKTLKKDGTVRTEAIGTDSIVWTEDKEGKILANSYNSEELPFTSRKWGLKSDKEGNPMLAYGEKQGRINAEKKMFEYTDGGFVRDYGSVTLEQRADGNVFITNEVGKEKEINGRYAERLLLLSKGADKIPEEYVKGLPAMLDAAKASRVHMKDLVRKDNALVTDDGKVRITYSAGAKGGEVTIAKGTFDESGTVNSENEYSKITYGADGKVRQSSIGMKDKDDTMKETKIEWSNADNSFTLDGTRYERVVDKNVVVYCPDGKRQGCINLDNHQVYNYDSEDESWKRCGKDCEEFEDTMKEHIEERRIASGGPNDREMMANRVFNVLESSQSGFGSLFSLFINKEDKAEWQAKVDTLLCESYLLGGKDCWTSYICSDYQDNIPGNVLSIQTPQGFLDITAFVEAERLDIQGMNASQREYLYKIRFMVKNREGSGKDIRFNVRIEGDQTLNLYENDIAVEEGGSFEERSGKNPFVEYSQNRYDRICIVFSEPVQKSKAETTREVCNAIVSLDVYAAPAQSQRNGERDI